MKQITAIIGNSWHRLVGRKINNSGPPAASIVPLANETVEQDRANLRPGLYLDGRCCSRLVLAVVGGHVIHSMDDANAPVIRLTSCSRQTMERAGFRLVRPFTEEEVAALKLKAISLRPYSETCRRDRILFWGDSRLPGLPEFPRRQLAHAFTAPGLATAEEVAAARLEAAVVSVLAEKARNRRNDWQGHFKAWSAAGAGWLRRRRCRADGDFRQGGKP